MSWPWTNGEILTATNLKDATKPVNAICQVSTSTGNTMGSGSTVTLSWETEVIDPRGWFAAGTPTVITPNIVGWYRVGIRGTVAADPDNDYTLFYISVQKNGAALHEVTIRPSAAASQPAAWFGCTPLIQMNGSSDTLRVQSAQVNTDADARTYVGYFDVELVYPT